MLKTLRRLTMTAALIGGSGLLGGCAPSNSYVQPVGLSGSNAATLIGTRTLNPDPAQGDLRVYVTKIDGRLTNGGPGGWNDPIRLTPGSHRLDFGIAVGRNAWGFGLGIYQFEAGKIYTLQGMPPRSETGPDSLFYGWVEGPDGQRMGDRIAVDVRPFTGGGPVYVPIFIK
jgi:hypothetical protein